MKPDAVVSRITIYPIKSLDGMDLKKAVISEGTCLRHDREYAMFDEAGKFINGKSNPRVHSLRSVFGPEEESISLKLPTDTNWNTFHLKDDIAAIEMYLSSHFGIKTFLKQNKTGRFLDVPDMGGVTLLSTASLIEVSTWYPDISLDQSRKRFRATLEIEGVAAFWEDQLFSDNGKCVEFKVGDVTLHGINPRERCVVPTRHPVTGSITHAFPKSFSKMRETTKPEWSRLEEYGHYYHLSVDCSIPHSELGKEIKVGDELRIIGPRIVEAVES
jgi:uncharacterized protein YcbX